MYSCLFGELLIFVYSLFVFTISPVITYLTTLYTMYYCEPVYHYFYSIFSRVSYRRNPKYIDSQPNQHHCQCSSNPHTHSFAHFQIKLDKMLSANKQSNQNFDLVDLLHSTTSIPSRENQTSMHGILSRHMSKEQYIANQSKP